jgi:hypothetical protein
MNVSGNIDDWSQINRARAEGRLFSNLKWPNDPGLVLSYVLVELYFPVILHLSNYYLIYLDVMGYRRTSSNDCIHF